MKNLMDVSGLTPQLALRSAAPASLEDLRRIHPDSYLERFKAISDNGGGMLGKEAPLGPGSYEIACLSAGLACAAVEAVLKGELDNAYSLSRPPGHHCLPDQSMDFVSSPIFPLPSSERKRSWGWARWRSLTGMFTTERHPAYLPAARRRTDYLLASGRLLPAGLRRRGRSRRGRGRRLQHQYSAVGRGGGMTAGAMRWKLSLFRRWRVLSRS